MPKEHGGVYNFINLPKGRYHPKYAFSDDFYAVAPFKNCRMPILTHCQKYLILKQWQQFTRGNEHGKVYMYSLCL